MVNLMKYTIVISFVLLMACSNLNASEPRDEYSILLSSLLKIKDDKYTYFDEKGRKQPSPLKKFKELEKIYINYTNPDIVNNKFSNKRLKIIMFYSFYSYVNNSGAFLEALATDLMPIYIKNPDAFLKILNELPFLIESNCNRLNAFFGFEGKNFNKKSNFINLNTGLFKKYLNSKQYELCINHFKEKPNK